jgi:chaperonin GroEL
LAKLVGGVAIVKVGAATEVELKEKKHRVEDAVEATKAAVEEGVVPGGGVAFLRARQVLQDIKVHDEEQVGVDILYKALEQPIRKIVENAGVDAGWVVREVERKQGDYGYDAAKLEFGNLTKKGIIDPAKVTRTALQNAASVAIMLLTTEALITDEPEEEKMPPMPAGGGMPGGMGM